MTTAYVSFGIGTFWALVAWAAGAPAWVIVCAWSLGALVGLFCCALCSAAKGEANG